MVAVSDNFKGKRSVTIYDSLVRNNTILPIIKCLKESHAKELHIWVTSQQIRFPCFIRINISTKELSANKFDHIREDPGPNRVI